MNKAGATNLKVEGTLHWAKTSNTLETLQFEKGGCRSPPPPSSYGGAALALEVAYGGINMVVKPMPPD